VFATIVEHDKALEINCRPERLDPPRELLRKAMDMGCRFSIDTDAHAPGQLAWQPYGATRAAECGLTPDRVVNARSADDLVAWATSHEA
jgi:putative hydrolase